MAKQWDGIRVVYRIIGEGDPEPVDSKKTVTREEVA